MPQIINTYYVPCKRFALICGLYGACQSFVWAITTVFFVVSPLYFDILKSSPDSKEESFNYYYYSMCSEFLLSLVWLVSSIHLVLRICNNEIPYPHTMHTKYACIVWAAVVLLQSALDLFLTVSMLWHAVLLPIRDAAVPSRISYVTYVFDCSKDNATLNVVDEHPDEHFTLKMLVGSRFVVFWYFNVLMAGVILVVPFSTVIGRKDTKTISVQHRDEDESVPDANSFYRESIRSSLNVINKLKNIFTDK